MAWEEGGVAARARPGKGRVKMAMGDYYDYNMYYHCNGNYYYDAYHADDDGWLLIEKQCILCQLID